MLLLFLTENNVRQLYLTGHKNATMPSKTSKCRSTRNVLQ